MRRNGMSALAKIGDRYCKGSLWKAECCCYVLSDEYRPLLHIEQRVVSLLHLLTVRKDKICAVNILFLSDRPLTTAHHRSMRYP